MATESKENGGFKGISKDDNEVLQKAAKMYTTLTGEPVKAAGQIPVLEAEAESPEERNKKAEEELKKSAELAQKSEEAAQRERRVKAGVDPETGAAKDVEPLLAPMAAKQYEGHKPSAGEPAGVKATLSGGEKAVPSGATKKTS